jgi:hypothetical protein
MIECRVIKQLSGVIDLDFTNIGPKIWVSGKFWQECVRKKFFDSRMSKKIVLIIFLECREKFFWPLKWYTDQKFFWRRGGGRLTKKIYLQGVIDFRRAILADTPQLKGASFAPGCRSHGGAGGGDQTVWGSSMLHPPPPIATSLAALAVTRCELWLFRWRSIYSQDIHDSCTRSGWLRKKIAPKIAAKVATVNKR